MESSPSGENSLIFEDQKYRLKAALAHYYRHNEHGILNEEASVKDNSPKDLKAYAKISVMYMLFLCISKNLQGRGT